MTQFYEANFNMDLLYMVDDEFKIKQTDWEKIYMDNVMTIC